MGFLGMGNYDKPGRGVDKNAPEKRALFKFLEFYFRKFWQIMNIALIYFFAAIPTFIITLAASFFAVSAFAALNGGALRSFLEYIGDYMYFVVMLSFFISLVYTAFIGGGAVSAGSSYVLGSLAGDYHTFIWQDFKEKTKENFKQGIAVYFIDIVAFSLLAYGFMIYYSFGGAIGYIRYIILVIAIIFAAMHIYIYPMMVSYELKLWDIYKNAFLITMANLFSNLLIMALIFALHIMFAIFIVNIRLSVLPIFMLVEAFLLYGLTGFISNFRAEIMFKKYFSVKGEESNGNN